MSNIVALRQPSPDQATFSAAIAVWIDNKRKEDALTPAEIGELKGSKRIDAQRKGIIMSLSHYYRSHPKADVAPGVAVLVSLLCDNDKGTCTLSQARIAAMFNRSRSCIAEAFARLKKDGLIDSGKGQAGAYPIIPRAVTLQYNHMIWLVDALAPPQASHNLLTNQAHSELSPSEGYNSKNELSSLRATIERELSPHMATIRNGSNGGEGEGDNFKAELSPHRATIQKGELSPKSGELSPCDGGIVATSGDTTSLRDLTKKNNIITGVAKAACTAGALMAGGADIPSATAQEPQPIVEQARQINFNDLSKILTDAAGSALRSPANCSGLLSMAIPRLWLEAGADLEMDIIPVIKATSARQGPGSISSWRYFEQAVMNAKASRERPLAVGNAGQPFSRPTDASEARRKNLRAEYKNAGLDPDDVLRMCIREKCWRRKAVGMWADTPEQAAAELERLGVSRSEWSTWTIEAPSA